MKNFIKEVIPKGGIFQAKHNEDLLEYIENIIEYLPWHLRSAFPLGLLLFEFGPFIFFFRFQRFSNLCNSNRKKYILSWAQSSFRLRQDLFKSLRALSLMAYFEQVEVKKLYNYMPQNYVEELGIQRLVKYENEIRRIQRTTS